MGRCCLLPPQGEITFESNVEEEFLDLQLSLFYSSHSSLLLSARSSFLFKALAPSCSTKAVFFSSLIFALFLDFAPFCCQRHCLCCVPPPVRISSVCLFVYLRIFPILQSVFLFFFLFFLFNDCSDRLFSCIGSSSKKIISKMSQLDLDQ